MQAPSPYSSPKTADVDVEDGLVEFLFRKICPVLYEKMNCRIEVRLLFWRLIYFWVSRYHGIIALPPVPMEMFYNNKFL
jgi:hypothetical protein